VVKNSRVSISWSAKTYGLVLFVVWSFKSQKILRHEVISQCGGWRRLRLRFQILCSAIARNSSYFASPAGERKSTNTAIALPGYHSTIRKEISRLLRRPYVFAIIKVCVRYSLSERWKKKGCWNKFQRKYVREKVEIESNILRKVETRPKFDIVKCKSCCRLSNAWPLTWIWRNDIDDRMFQCERNWYLKKTTCDSI